MFHRSNKGMIHQQSVNPSDRSNSGHNNKTDQNYQRRLSPQRSESMNQTAVKPYTRSQNEGREENNSANQNTTSPYAVRRAGEKREINTSINMKEANIMNKPQPQNNQGSSDNQSQNSAPSQGNAQQRVAIPGNNFSRPGAPANRPAYPGNYPGATVPAAPAPASSYSPQQNTQEDMGRKLLIGQGISMSGEIESCDHLIVEGTIEASLKGASLLEVAESGAYFGTVEIEEANIAGRFEGDITVRGRLTIESTGVIIGSVTYKELAIEAGATLDGSVSPIGSEQSSRQSNLPKKAPMKSRKVSGNNDAELPFSNKAAE